MCNNESNRLLCARSQLFSVTKLRFVLPFFVDTWMALAIVVMREAVLFLKVSSIGVYCSLEMRHWAILKYSCALSYVTLCTKYTPRTCSEYLLYEQLSAIYRFPFTTPGTARTVLYSFLYQFCHLRMFVQLLLCTILPPTILKRLMHTLHVLHVACCVRSAIKLPKSNNNGLHERQNHNNVFEGSHLHHSCSSRFNKFVVLCTQSFSLQQNKFRIYPTEEISISVKNYFWSGVEFS